MEHLPNSLIFYQTSYIHVNKAFYLMESLLSGKNRSSFPLTKQLFKQLLEALAILVQRFMKWFPV